jgi:DNA primase
MTTITSNDIEKCRTIPIHRLVGDHRINRKVKIQCPFHAERTGSCVLFPTGGYHCFGCGAHGNTVDFVMKLGGTFEEAINELKIYI